MLKPSPVESSARIYLGLELENLLDTLSGQYPDIPGDDLIRLVANALNAPGVYRKICAEIDHVKKEGGPALRLSDDRAGDKGDKGIGSHLMF